MKDVQCYELFGGIALKSRASSLHFFFSAQLDRHVIVSLANV